MNDSEMKEDGTDMETLAVREATSLPRLADGELRGLPRLTETERSQETHRTQDDCEPPSLVE